MILYINTCGIVIIYRWSPNKYIGQWKFIVNCLTSILFLSKMFITLLTIISNIEKKNLLSAYYNFYHAHGNLKKKKKLKQ